MNEIVYISYDPEGYNDEFEEMGLDDTQVTTDAIRIARLGGINIMRNMNLTGFLINQSNNDVAGALWVNEPTVYDYFSFDMAIHPNYRGRGLADKLVKAMIEEYKFFNSIYMEMHNKRLPLQITVVNPILINVLKKYGFRVTEKIDGEKVYMTHDTLKEYNLIKIVNEEIKLLNEAPASQIWEKYYNTIPHEQFLDIIAADPTSDVEKDKMGKYSKWLLNLYKRKTMQLEDLYKAEEYLETFEKYINRIQNKDINKYRSLADLYNVIRGFIDSDEPTSRNDAIRRIKKDAKKVFEDDTWLVVVPETEEAACYYGKNTQWCTAAEKSRNMFDSYNNSGNLYININKKTNEKYQFHFENEEFKDETDEDILPDDVGISPDTGIFNFYKKKGYDIPEPTIRWAIKNGDFDLLQDLLWYDEKTQATEDDFYSAIDVNYSMADTIFWNIDVNNLSRWAAETYLEYFDNLNDGRFYPEDETNQEYVTAIRDTVEHIMQIDSVDEDRVLKFVFNKLEEIENIKMVLDKNFNELVDRLINSDLSPDDLEDIAYTFNIDEKTVYELVQNYKSREEFKKIANKPMENDRIKIKVGQVNFNKDDNKFYYYVKILFKKNNKQYEGWLEKSKAYRLLTQYDLFHGE